MTSSPLDDKLGEECPRQRGWLMQRPWGRNRKVSEIGAEWGMRVVQMLMTDRFVLWLCLLIPRGAYLGVLKPHRACSSWTLSYFCITGFLCYSILFYAFTNFILMWVREHHQISDMQGSMAHKNNNNSSEPFQFLLQEVFLDLPTSGLLLSLCFPHYCTQHVRLYWSCYQSISPTRL